MGSNFLRTALEAEARSAKKRRLIALLCGSGALLIVVVGIVWHSADHHNAKQHVALAADASQNAGSLQVQGSSSNDTAQTNTPAVQSSGVAAQTPAPSTKPQPVGEPPATTPFDEAAFIAAGNTAVGNYLQIVNLLTFDSSTSDVTKTSHINQAAVLEKTALQQAGDMRLQLVLAGINSGAYMDLTELEENGTASIGVGVTFAGYWAADHSKVSDLNSGLDDVSKGGSHVYAAIAAAGGTVISGLSCRQN